MHKYTSNEHKFKISLQLRLCAMACSKKRYVRAGDYMEVRLSKYSAYNDMVTTAIEILEVEEEEEVKGMGEPRLFRIDGTVVPECEVPWTISRYLRSLHKSPGQIKLGVGYYYQVSRLFLCVIVSV